MMPVVFGFVPAATLLIGQVLNQQPTEALRQALVLFNSGKYQDCRVLAVKYLEQFPDSAAGQKVLGMDEFMLGNTREALAHVLRATELAPKDPEAYYYLGRLYFSTDDASAALAALQKANELDPTSVRTYNQLGQTYEVLGRLQEAELAYTTGVEVEKTQTKKSEWLHYNLGVLYLNKGRRDDAVRCFREAIARSPSFPEAKIKLAVALSNKEPVAESFNLLEEALTTDPQNSEGHYRLALLLAKSGKTDEARIQFGLFEKYRKAK